MKTPLVPLQQLIDGLQFLRQPNDMPTYELIASIHRSTITAIDLVKAAFDTCIRNGLHDQAMNRYVSICQQRLSAASNDLPPSWLDTEIATAFQGQEHVILLRTDICFQLDDLLQYLRDTFPLHFNRQAVVPAIHREIIRQQLLPGIPLIKRWFGITDDSCHELQDLIIRMFNALDPMTPNRLNDINLQFLVQLHGHLLRLLEQESCNLQHDQLHYVLLCLNCNTTDYYYYFTNHISRRLAITSSSEAQLQLLRNYQRDVEQLHLKSGQAYSPDAPSIRELMQEWLFVEINFLERELEEPAHEKIPTNMSVTMMAIIVKLLRTMGQLSHKHAEEIFRVLPNYFMARRNEPFTEGIFRAKYKEITASTLHKITDLGQELLKMLRPEERPSRSRR